MGDSRQEGRICLTNWPRPEEVAPKVTSSYNYIPDCHKVFLAEALQLPSSHGEAIGIMHCFLLSLQTFPLLRDARPTSMKAGSKLISHNES